ncbi:MAG: hypothetical protein L0312_16365 [Acidobacteria bacterium]|nr:hypothetical protein [Acidobacteriota bacterium]
MLQVTITAESLRDCLAGVESVKLLGMELLNQFRPQGDLFPTGVPRSAMKEAVAEIMDYTNKCITAAGRLQNLAPIPLTRVSILEFGL